MNASHSTAISICYLSWINEELRKEVEVRETLDRKSSFVSRHSTSLLMGVYGVAILVTRFLNF